MNRRRFFSGIAAGLVLSVCCSSQASEWNLYDHLNDPSVEVRSDMPYVWVVDWVGSFSEKRTGWFHPTLKDGYEHRKGHYGSVDRCDFPFTEEVQGTIAKDQVHVHPDTSELPVVIKIAFDKLDYRYLNIDYALADNALPDSNGTDLEVRLDQDSEETTLITDHVKKNKWVHFDYDLKRSTGQKVYFKIVAGGHGSTTHDWLKIRFSLK